MTLMRALYSLMKALFRNYSADYIRVARLQNKITPEKIWFDTKLSTKKRENSMPNMTGRPGYRTMEMNGGCSSPYLACTPCVPLFCTLFNRGGNRRAFRLPGAGGGSFPLYGGTFARSFSVSKERIRKTTRSVSDKFQAPLCQARKKSTNPNFRVWIFSGGVGVFHVKGWGPKSSIRPSKPREIKLFGRDIPPKFCRDIPPSARKV